MFKSGDEALACGELPAFRVKLLWPEGRCLECNEDTWRCRWIGRDIELTLCQSILREPND